ncbi:hypothetical protein [Hoeflea poritis]|uniref:Uncharacterized protein n=1 Tax=Hoeflea poritis TaxID=2993659 RepID=A0ABT4VL31_9HYPH|nr:hypothetical protein [Hoeflea poritis]MDA4845413.1 hypothetical protein [Hoeflea poritis]
MKRFIKRNALWGAYIVFLVLAATFGAREGALDFSGPGATGKAAIWAVFIAFLIYSIQAHRKEVFLRSVAKVNQLWWGLQIGLDLYISVFLSLALIYLVEGSLAVMLLWALPVLVFANLAILPYLILNFGAVFSAFAG